MCPEYSNVYTSSVPFEDIILFFIHFGKITYKQNTITRFYMFGTKINNVYTVVHV